MSGFKEDLRTTRRADKQRIEQGIFYGTLTLWSNT